MKKTDEEIYRERALDEAKNSTDIKESKVEYCNCKDSDKKVTRFCGNCGKPIHIAFKIGTEMYASAHHGVQYAFRVKIKEDLGNGIYLVDAESEMRISQGNVYTNRIMIEDRKYGWHVRSR